MKMMPKVPPIVMSRLGMFTNSVSGPPATIPMRTSPNATSTPIIVARSMNVPLAPRSYEITNQ